MPHTQLLPYLMFRPYHQQLPPRILCYYSPILLSSCYYTASTPKLCWRRHGYQGISFHVLQCTKIQDNLRLHSTDFLSFYGLAKSNQMLITYQLMSNVQYTTVLTLFILAIEFFNNSRLITNSSQTLPGIESRLLAQLSATLTITLECFMCLYEAVIESYSCQGDSVQFV